MESLTATSLLGSLTATATTFGLIFLAEIGDKSQLVCMALAARHRHRPVLLGAGNCQDSCRLHRCHTACSNIVCSRSRSGLRETTVIGVQLRVGPLQRSGCWSRAAWLRAWR